MINATGENTPDTKRNRRRAKKGVSTSQPAITKVIKTNVEKKIGSTPQGASSVPISKHVPKPDEQEEPDIKSDFTYDLFEMNDLTSQPTPDDTILFAIPVAAPYSTMNNYKYKVKMQPGTTKKGKAARAAVSVFIGMKEGTNVERDLIKAVNESELFKNLPGKVKLVNTGNLSKGGKKR